jgi:hypothetical protein
MTGDWHLDHPAKAKDVVLDAAATSERMTGKFEGTVLGADRLTYGNS